MFIAGFMIWAHFQEHGSCNRKLYFPIFESAELLGLLVLMGVITLWTFLISCYFFSSVYIRSFFVWCNCIDGSTDIKKYLTLQTCHTCVSPAVLTWWLPLCICWKGTSSFRICKRFFSINDQLYIKFLSLLPLFMFPFSMLIYYSDLVFVVLY